MIDLMHLPIRYMKKLKVRYLGEKLPTETKIGDYIVRAVNDKMLTCRQNLIKKYKNSKGKGVDENLKAQFTIFRTKGCRSSNKC